MTKKKKINEAIAIPPALMIFAGKVALHYAMTKGFPLLVKNLDKLVGFASEKMPRTGAFIMSVVGEIIDMVDGDDSTDTKKATDLQDKMSRSSFVERLERMTPQAREKAFKKIAEESGLPENKIDTLVRKLGNTAFNGKKDENLALSLIMSALVGKKSQN